MSFVIISEDDFKFLTRILREDKKSIVATEKNKRKRPKVDKNQIKIKPTENYENSDTVSDTDFE